MITSLPGYSIEELLHEGPTSIVFRARREHDNETVIVKLPGSEFASATEIAKLQRDFDITRSLEHPGIVRGIELLSSGGQVALIMEDSHAISLRTYQNNKPLSFEIFFLIAIQVTNALGYIHYRRIIHKDITPDNILINPLTVKACITDFGISSVLLRESHNVQNALLLEGTLPYISPEQTGRMNRAVEYRSDFYSLGAVFYEMLTGQPPFTATDPLELVHNHIAMSPQPLSELRSDIPLILESLILRLLSKNAEQRYQSASGITEDLRRMSDEYGKKGNITTFTLAAHDVPNYFQIPQKLYGREEEIKSLLSAFDEAGEGRKKFLLVGGHSGIGKTALINEVQKPIVRKRGYFTSGKFDQLRRDIPYSSISAALRAVLRTILAESPELVENWRSRLQQALQPNGKVLVDIIPEIELLIGEQPPIPELSPTEAQNRFDYVFQNFMGVLCYKEHPLVLFLDDLQWADAASLRMLNLIVLNPDIKFLLLIGAYRDNEVDENHLLYQILKSLELETIPPEYIFLQPLTKKTLTELVSDTLHVTTIEAGPVSEILFTKTQGNPFFTNELLLSLFRDGIIAFDLEASHWICDISRLREASISDNVVELMSSKILQLPKETQQVIQFAACIGNQFDLSTLSTVSGRTSQETAQSLDEALQSGLILPIDSVYKFAASLQTAPQIRYRFLHDRVQQAAYLLIEESKRVSVHARIGLLMLEHMRKQERLFEIANHLNLGIRDVIDQGIRLRIAELNLQAGMRAQASTAYDAAFHYFENGIRLLPEDSWQNFYDLSLELFIGAAETSFLINDFEGMESFVNEVLGGGRTLLHKVRAHEVRILALIARGRLLDAIDVGLEVLALFGIKLPPRPGDIHLMRWLIRSKIVLMGKPVSSLANSPLMTDEQKLTAMRLIGRILSASYIALPKLFALLIFTIVIYSVRFGNSLESSYSYSGYAIVEYGVLGALKSGDQFMMLALETLDRMNVQKVKQRVYLGVYGFIYHFTHPFRESIEKLQEAYHIGIENGDVEYACWLLFFKAIHIVCEGNELSKAEQQLEIIEQAVAKHQNEAPLQKVHLYQQYIENFKGESAHFLTLKGTHYDEDVQIPLKKSTNDMAELFHIAMLKLKLAYLAGEYETALLFGNECNRYADAVASMAINSWWWYYDALASIALSSSQKKKRFLVRARKKMKKLEAWAKHAPFNYEGKFLLLQAEYSASKGEEAAASKLYEASISHARSMGYLDDEAIAFERAGRFYHTTGRPMLAQFYLSQARYLYERLGASPKVKQLSLDFPTLSLSSQRRAAVSTESFVADTTISSYGESLDLTSILRASTAISGEIVLDNLLSRLMGILIESAGAETGYFLLNRNSKLTVEVHSSLGEKSVKLLSSQAIEDNKDLPLSIIRYVARTKEDVILEKFEDESKFSSDDYLTSNKPESVLCMPVMNQGELIGIIYLENRLSRYVFTSQRAELLHLFSGQIAVSISNALVYQNLEEKVVERTHQISLQKEIIEHEKEKADELLHNILPLETAEELKAFGHVRPRGYDEVTILFSDIRSFTTIAESMTAEELVHEIDTYFSAMDKIVEQFGLEKIKTIGDAYMCVGGLPTPLANHAECVISAALEMQNYLKGKLLLRTQSDKPPFEIRIGIHTGRVIAGVVGTRKFAYDIWGDAVNVASRMESASEPGRVNISGETYKLVSELFVCEYRGKISAKNKGEIDMYFVGNHV